MRNANRHIAGLAGHSRGFTLIELLLVLVILAVLAAVVVPKFTNRSEQARTAAAQTDISVIEGAIDTFEVDCGRFPTNDEGISALVQAPGDVQNWRGPYIKRGIPDDPWGNPYQYLKPGVHGEFDVFSFGADGKTGGADLDADIGNWEDS